jgi:site-specific DNA-methyltransferase (adenine-specific)
MHMTPEKFLDGRVDLWCGDSREVLALLPDNSIDSCVTDPPYSLVSIIKRFGKDGSAPVKSNGATGVYRRAAAGFMNARWDTGEVAFDPEFWKQVLRVLKPGGHVLAMGGTRTFHHLAMAIEDAGFEIRDTVLYLYGSGFPKSHNVSKGIDRRGGVMGDGNRDLTRAATDAARQWEGWGTALKPAAEFICVARKPLSEKTVAANVLKWGTGALNIDGCRVESDGEHKREFVGARPDREIYGSRPRLNEGFQPTNAEGRWPANVIHDGSEEVVAGFPDQVSGGTPPSRPRDKTRNTYGKFDGQENPDGIGPTAGNASRFFYQAKPDEPKGRWPANVIHDGSEEVVGAFPDRDGAVGMTQHGSGTNAVYGKFDRTEQSTGGNGTKDTGSAARFFYQAKQDEPKDNGREGEASANKRYTDEGSTNFAATPGPRGGDAKGRWPANVIHDGSEEVVGAFPETVSGGAQHGSTINSKTPGMFGVGVVNKKIDCVEENNGGSAARFFYTAKANQDDRLGSKHPTVKPLSLMQYLIRLVCPKGGTVLDPFAGSGTTGEAAYREGARAVLIEREMEYCQDIRRRISLAAAGPEERKRKSIEAGGKTQSADNLPLFSSGVI